VLGVYLATDPSDVNEALQIICKEIRAIRKGDITPSELAETKEHLIGGILLGAESTDARMMRLAKNEYVFGRYVECEEVIAQIEKVNLDQLVAVAEEAFGKEGVSLATLGPLEEKDLDAGCLNF
jgi:predicted Zn-dependent peptidase